LNEAALPNRALALLFPLLLSIPPAAADDVRGKVVSVHDGDTITVLIDRHQVKVRLTDIDAPELGQPFGTRSRQSLSEMCFGKEAALEVRGQDRFRRTLAQVSCAGMNANAEQVRRGYAWTFVRYTGPNSPLYALENEARMNRRGLWADPASIPPWEWRRNGRRMAQGDPSVVSRQSSRFPAHADVM
jgi:endonuclease YncB( thermonuclease family)